MGFAERVLARAAPEQRAITEWGTSAIPGPLGNLTGGGGSYSSVDLRRAEASLQKVAVWSAVDLIAGVASQLPLQTFQTQPDGAAKVMASNPQLVDDPGGEDQGAGDWIYQYLASKLLRGNAFGKLASFDTRYNTPTQIVLYHPDDVSGYRDPETGAAVWRVNGREVPAGSMWHRRAYPAPGQLLGLSPVGQHATTIGQGIAAARFGQQFFTDGGHPTAVVQNSEEEIDQKKAVEVKARWVSAVWGSREPVVMGRGWDFKPLSISPDESQFLETQKFTGAECCRIFGPNIAEILGYETGGSMTYANQEQRAIDFLKFTLNRWLRDIETVLSKYLPRPQYVRFDRKVLLETDLLSRYQAHQTARNIGLSNVDELRGMEDMPPLPNGQGQDYTPLLVQVAASRGIDAAQVSHNQNPSDQPATRGGGVGPKGDGPEARKFNPDEPRRPDGKWGTGGGVIHKLLKSLHEAGNRDGAYFDDGQYMDWSVRKPDGSFGFEAGNDHGAVQLDVDPESLAGFHDLLTSSLRRNSDDGFALSEDDSRATDWQPLDEDGERWQFDITDANGDSATLDLSRADVQHLHHALTATLLADAIGKPDGAAEVGRLMQSLDLEFRGAGHDTTPGHDQLHHYWTKGEGLAKWAGSPKPWTTLRDHLLKYLPPEEATRTATVWFHEVFGFYPGSDLNRVTHGKPPRGHRIGPG